MKKLGCMLSAVVLSVVLADSAFGQEPKACRWGASAYFIPGRQLVVDSYERKWLQGKESSAVGLKLTHAALPSDSDAYAHDYRYPTLSLGLNYSMNHGVTMHRSPDPDWGLAQMVDYDSRLGNTVSAYLEFARPLLRSGRWEVDYTLAAGIGYNKTKYNPENNVDNELIGSRWLIYFGAGTHVCYQFCQDWALKAGVDFFHHSNGALNRPNKGSNTWGPSLALCYRPYYRALTHGDSDGDTHSEHPSGMSAFKKYCFLNFVAGIGGKTMLEDWKLTQFNTPPGDADYRTSDFRFYMAYSLQTDVMYRYARRWASGLGVDFAYGTYADHIRQLDEKMGKTARHSPWSLGLAVRHEAYYHRLALSMSVGVYLHRQMGADAKIVEKPYYEKIGLSYAFPSLGGLSVGGRVNAHSTKADFTEFVLSYPLRLFLL